MERTDQQDYASHKRGLITQGRHFCSITAPECRDKIARLAVGFLRDDATVSNALNQRTPLLMTDLDSWLLAYGGASNSESAQAAQACQSLRNR